MAHTINIKAIPVASYQELRSTLQSGDLLFTSGEYLASQAIQKVTNSNWSHVGIVFKLESIDRILLLESVENMGVRFAPLSKYLTSYHNNKPYKGEVVLARCNNVNQKVINEIAKFGIDELTRPYDKDAIAKILARIALGIGKKEDDREYICSELVYECFAKAGIKFDYDKRGFISPENIWSDDRVSLVARIL